MIDAEIKALRDAQVEADKRLLVLENSVEKLAEALTRVADSQERLADRISTGALTVGVSAIAGMFAVLGILFTQA